MKENGCYPEDALTFIFNNTDSFEEIQHSLNNKKRILIYCDWNSVKEYEQELFKLLKLADKDVYDFTLVYKSKIKASLAEKRLMAFPEHVRVLYRTGGFACTPEEYVEFHSHIDKIQFLNDFTEYVTEINKEIYNAEIIRMAGINSFDIFLYFGPAYYLWYSIAECVNAKKKIKLEVEDYEAVYKMNEVHEDKIRELNNNLLLGKQIFDTVFVTESANFPKKMLSVSGLQPEKCTIPLDCSAISMNESEIKETSIEGKNYGVLDVVHGSEAVKLCQLVSIPDKQKNAYITYGKSQGIGDVIKYYTENRKTDDVLYIYGGNETQLKNSVDFYGITEDAVLVEELDINCIDYLQKYLEVFTGYIAADNSYNEIFWLMQSLGKPIKYIDESVLVNPTEDITALKEIVLKQFFPEF